MKNSSNYLLAAVLVLLASLTAYNMALRAEYRRGDYKNPLRGYVAQGFRDFTEVVVPASNVVSVKIVPGPFSVRLNPGAAEYVHLRQQGGRLVITAAFPRWRRYFGPAETVLISCPRLAALSTDAVYESQGKPLTTNDFRDYEKVLVQGFRQDSLVLRQDHGSHIELADNELGMLSATAGPSLGSHGLLQLNRGNRIAAASLALAHQSELVLDNVQIPQLHRQFSDSAKVTLTGAALGSVLR
ncbi:hypothetical protein [Hymenobacter cheonanensis]|uniref:hypothetical protein n=1 Tax=Hymenobacter sp. CA2-7 TaxID=3063993 RepID=UPI002713C407|nr:hypothetical protein [Hymenobacter sp. CA2-7]MDO7887176.1 hypothetical protein [Hymenobacter sp. CA2-7]